MRNYILLGVLALALWILYSLNIQYGWVELQMDWAKIAIAVAAAGGPIQFLRSKWGNQMEEEVPQKPKLRTVSKAEVEQRRMRYQQLEEQVEAKSKASKETQTSTTSNS